MQNFLRLRAVESNVELYHKNFEGEKKKNPNSSVPIELHAPKLQHCFFLILCIIHRNFNAVLSTKKCVRFIKKFWEKCDCSATFSAIFIKSW